ncbi:TonB-dependent receptor plug domain-containing protein [Muriicola sp.]|uniref:TonB-dependent receptor plug domain-containing protein n=1 Tax=Muriicola sp. TaxID=2020856 RepID=UPI003C776F6F
MIRKSCKTFALLCIGSSLFAQQDFKDSTKIQELDEVVVSDTRFPIKRENSGKTVIRIGPEELSESRGRSLPEIINTKSGIEISGSRGRPGEILGTFIRGGRGKQVIVVIDGIRVSDPSSFSQEYDLRLLPTSSIESVEIIKGASSVLYGANAATAVINIRTKNASDRNIAGAFQSSAGSNQTTDEQRYRGNSFANSARIDGTIDKWEYSLGFSHRFVDGMSSIQTETNEEDPFSTVHTDIKIGYQFSPAIKTIFYGNQTYLRSAYDESFGLADAPYSFKSKQERLGLTSVFSYGRGSTTLNIAYASYDSENFSNFPGSFRGQNVIGDLFNKSTMGKFLLITGVNYNLERTEFEDYRQFVFADPYASLVFLEGGGFQVNVGGRLNNHSEYGSKFVYSINPSYALLNEKGYLKFLGSFATAYVTPSLTQLFGQFGANPELKPESNRTIEAGTEYAISGKLRASVLYFDRKEKDFVFFDNASFQYNNSVNTISAKGMEVEIKWQAANSVTVEANYTFTERTGDNAIRIPKHQVNTSIGYQFSDSWRAALSYGYTGSRRDTDFGTFEEVVLDPFGLLGFYTSYDVIPDKFSVFLNGDNLLNKSFTEVIGFNTRGRNIQMGFTLNL